MSSDGMQLDDGGHVTSALLPSPVQPLAAEAEPFFSSSATAVTPQLVGGAASTSGDDCVEDLQPPPPPPSDQLVSVTDPDGVTQVLKARQMPIPEIYKLQVARTGRRIVDSEEDDMRLFVALSIAQSPTGDADMAEQLQKITTSAQLREFFEQRNTAVGNIHHMLDAQEEKALASGKAFENPLEKQTIRDLVRATADQLQAANMVEDTPDIRLAENTTAARAAVVRRLQAQGVDVLLTKASPELRAALAMPDDDARHALLVKQATQAVAAVEAGLQTAAAADPSKPADAETLARVVEGTALLEKRRREAANPITRCDRSAATPQTDRFYSLEARVFANEMDERRFGCRRLDRAAPIAPITADRMMAEVLEGSFVAEFFAPRLDVAVHPSKLYLYLTGCAHAKMVQFSDVKLFYLALMRELGQTDMRPTEAQVVEYENAERAALHAKMTAAGIAGVINNAPLADEHRAVHSKERIVAVQRASYGQAQIAFFEKVVRIVAATAADDDSRRACLARLYEAVRTFCVETLHSYELALMLYYEEYIPVQCRADLMTPLVEACEHCTPADVKAEVKKRREWVSSFRTKTLLVDEQRFARAFALGNLELKPEPASDCVDALRSWSPTHDEMWHFLRFVSLKLSTSDADEFTPRAERWTKRYIDGMHSSNSSTGTSTAKK